MAKITLDDLINNPTDATIEQFIDLCNKKLLSDSDLDIIQISEWIWRVPFTTPKYQGVIELYETESGLKARVLEGTPIVKRIDKDPKPYIKRITNSLREEAIRQYVQNASQCH